MKAKKIMSVGLLLVALAAAFLASPMMKPPSAGGDHTTVKDSNRRAAGTVVTPSAGGDNHTSCHLEGVQDPGQDPGQEEGNPSHKRPLHSCNHKPGKKQVLCHCQVDCNPDGTEREDTRCRSYCYKDMCTCPRKPCAD